MEVRVSMSLFQEQLASPVERAVKAAVDSVLREITEAVSSKFTEIREEMTAMKRENERLKLRLEISESELRAVRGSINAADTDIKQPFIFQDPRESHTIPESKAQEEPKIEAVSTQEESFEQECCACLMQVTELPFVKDEEVPEQQCVPIKEEIIEQECVSIAEEPPPENNACTLEDKKQLGSRLYGDSPSECELGFRDPRESHTIPESKAQEKPEIEAVSTQEESFEQECCACLMQVTELPFVKDEEVPEQQCVPIKEEIIEQECVSIAEEPPPENNACTLEDKKQLGSRLCDDSPSECELGFRDPRESHTIPESKAQEKPEIEAVSTQEESFEEECCASLMQVTELLFVKDEEVPEQQCVPIKEEIIEQECVSITEEPPPENNACTLEDKKQLGSRLCDDSPSECELGFRDPRESHAIPESETQEEQKIEAVSTQEESFEQDCCASLMQVTELQFVKDEEVPEQQCVPIKEEFIEQECVSIAEELPHENNACTLEDKKKLGSRLCDDSPSECELGFRASKLDEGEPDCTPSPHCKNSSSGKPQCKKRRETTPQEEYVKTLRTHSVKIPSLQDRPPLTVESTETPHSACFNSSETQGNLKTLPHYINGGKSSCQLDIPETHKGNPTGGTTFSWADCGKSFNHISLLKRHQHIHIGEKPSHIQSSDKSFTQLGNLHSHQRIHCTECGKTFSHTRNLKKHKTVHTGEKPHHCAVCGKRFSQSGDLKRHHKIHTGEKPYHCAVCGKRFSLFGNLKIHQRIHTGEKPYHCTECGKRFSHIGSLKNHKAIHT
ncbi:zinc finger protein 333-like isoform X2 [Polyodon spathula]|uniref:zinc finger protein 333-like isoform X2 n=1 Tax=Polyodon spathula TaxID=7913 RepID=UPI001B7E4667|nr:zinc finger protein 333-like isoform X2 [Polyodon spathula]